jgi:hypothetical protein
MEIIESYFTNMKEYEVLKTNGDKRLVKRIRYWNRKNTKREIIDYCLQEKIQGFEDERWRIVYFNRSRKLVERRFLGL